MVTQSGVVTVADGSGLRVDIAFCFREALTPVRDFTVYGSETGQLCDNPFRGG